MTREPSIRLAPLPLAALLAALHIESFGEESWNVRQIRGSLALTTTRAWIAYDGETPAGFVLCQMLPEEAEILTFCVLPALRRRRIGEALLSHALDAVKSEGAQKIFLEVASDNTAARRLYERLGFEISGTRANYYKRGAVTVDAVMYEWTAP